MPAAAADFADRDGVWWSRDEEVWSRDEEVWSRDEEDDVE